MPQPTPTPAANQVLVFCTVDATQGTWKVPKGATVLCVLDAHPPWGSTQVVVVVQMTEADAAAWKS